MKPTLSTLPKMILSSVLLSSGLLTIASTANAQVAGSICQVGQNCGPGVGGGSIGGDIRPGVGGRPDAMPRRPGRPRPGHRPGHGGGYGGGPLGPIDPSPYNPGPSNPPPYNPPPSSGYSERKEAYLGQYYRNQYIDLLAAAGVGSQYRGSEIVSVQVIYQTNGRAALYLFADQTQVASMYADGYNTVLNPDRRLILGQNLRSLQMYVSDKLYVERVIIEIQRGSNQPPPPPPPPQQPPSQNGVTLSGYVNQQFYSPGNVDVAAITGLRQYGGYQLSAVIVNGRALNQGNGHARVLVNGVIVGDVWLGAYSGGQAVYPQQTWIVGRNLDDVTLLIDGGTEIQNVQVQLSRF